MLLLYFWNMGHVDGAPGVLDMEMDKTIESWRGWRRGREGRMCVRGEHSVSVMGVDTGGSPGDLTFVGNSSELAVKPLEWEK